MKKRQKQFNIRLKFVFVGIVFIGFVLITNLFYIQIQVGDELRAEADGQYVASSNHLFERGNIYFTNKDDSFVVAAGQKSGYKVTVNPSKLNEDDYGDIIQALQKFDSFQKDTFLKQVKNKKRTYLEILHRVSKEEKKEIEQALRKKVSFYVEKWRTYPLKRSASHVLGFLGYDKDNNYNGRYGLERQYEQTLRREDKELYTNFFARVFHGTKNLLDEDKKTEGDIVVSIEPQIQLFLERELSQIQKKWKSEATGGIIMDARTGEIYAMSLIPDFDNNDFSHESLSVFKNSLVSNVYEFGSIMKPLVVSIGLDKKIINANTEYYDRGSVKVEKHTIYNFDKKARGWVTVQDILNQSLNTGMVFISKKIPKSVFREYFKRYGFGEKSGIDLPNVSSGLTSNLKSNRDIEFANMSFGQGIAISPVSFIKALSALANDGKTVIPHLVTKIKYTNGFSKTFDYSEEGEQVLSPETSHEISRMLVEVFDHYRQGKAKLPHYRIAVKTGTAQIANPEGGYYKNKHLHSFFGYFPAYDPQFIVLLYTVNPKGIKYASQTLLDPFRETAKYLINYYNIPPDR